MPQPFSNLKDGSKNVTTAGTRVQLASPTPCGEVTVTARVDNASDIVYGGATVVAALVGRSGTPLSPGQPVNLKIDDLSKIWLDALSSGDGVTFSYLF